MGGPHRSGRRSDVAAAGMSIRPQEFVRAGAADKASKQIGGHGAILHTMLMRRSLSIKLSKVIRNDYLNRWYRTNNQSLVNQGKPKSCP